MMVTLNWHEVAAWVLVIVSFTLFVLERRRNDHTRYYMVLQGILRACHKRAGFYASRATRLKSQSPQDVAHGEHLLLVEGAYTEYAGLMEQLMGSMRSLEPDRDLPFDVASFLGHPDTVKKTKEGGGE